MIHLRRWIFATCVLIVAYSGYAWGIAPLLEPPPVVVGTGDPPPDPVPKPQTPRDDLMKLFAEDAWERNAAKIIETEQCTLLLKDYQPTPDGRLEIKPATLVFFAAGEKDANGKLKSKGRPHFLMPGGCIRSTCQSAT